MQRSIIQERAEKYNTRTCRERKTVQRTQDRVENTRPCREHNNVQRTQQRAENTRPCREHNNVQRTQKSYCSTRSSINKDFQVCSNSLSHLIERTVMQCGHFFYSSLSHIGYGNNLQPWSLRFFISPVLLHYMSNIRSTVFFSFITHQVSIICQTDLKAWEFQADDI